MEKALAAVLIVAGLLGINGVLEGQRAYWFFEALRWPLTLLPVLYFIPLQ